MDEIFRISDTITVLRDGQWIGTKPAKELDNDMLIKMMVGRELTDIYPKDPVEIGDVILEVKKSFQRKESTRCKFFTEKGEVLELQVWWEPAGASWWRRSWIISENWRTDFPSWKRSTYKKCGRCH